MGGTSTNQSTTNQNTNQSGTQSQNENTNQFGTGLTAQSGSTGPWAASMPFLSGMLGQLNTAAGGNLGMTTPETGAYETIARNAGNTAGIFGNQLGSIAQSFMNGGGANNTDTMATGNLADYNRRLAATANGSNIGANSGLQPYLNTLSNDITNQVNGSFAGAGRDFSGANQQALGRGIAQGLSPVIAGQYNTDVGNMLGAAGNLYNAGNTTAGMLANNNAQANANRVTGAGLIPGLAEMQNAAPNAVLQAEAARRGIPLQTLGLLAQIGVPIAGLGQTTSSTGATSQNQTGTGSMTGTSTGTSSGTSNTSGRNTMSGAQQFGTIAQGIGSLIPRGPMTFAF